MRKIIGAILIFGDIFAVYYIGLNETFGNFGIALIIVFVAVLGGYILAKG